MTPFELTFRASDCREGALIEPVFPLIVAEQLVKVMVPKFDRGAMPPINPGAATIHSAVLRSGSGSWYCEGFA